MFGWFWQQCAALQVVELEKIVVAALTPRQTAAVFHYCQLCQCFLPQCVSLGQHVSTDIGHMAKVSDRFEEVSPACRGWVQCWPGVAEFNHLTLDVSDLRAREGGSEVPAAVVGGRVSAHAEVDEQLCVAVQPVTGDAGDQEEQADPRIVSADATPWLEFKDPETGRYWWWHSKSGECSWNDPKVMGSCGATAALTAGTGGEPSGTDVFDC